MFSNGMWALSGLLEANPDMADQIGFAPYPAYMPDSKPVVLCAEDSGYSISASSANMGAGEGVPELPVQRRKSEEILRILGSPSAFKDVDAAWAPEGFVKEVNDVLNSP